MSVKYKILTTEEPDTLHRCVQRYLDDGWMLYGDPFLGRGAKIHQAVTLHPLLNKPMKCIREGCDFDAAPEQNYCRAHIPDPWGHL